MNQTDTTQPTKSGFTQIPNLIYEQIYKSKFSKRELFVLLYVIRLTYGCQCNPKAKMKLVDFMFVGVHPSDAGKVVKGLVEKKVLGWERRANQIWINEQIDEWVVKTHESIESYIMDYHKSPGELLSRNLANIAHKKRLRAKLNMSKTPSQTEENKPTSDKNQPSKDNTHNKDKVKDKIVNVGENGEEDSFVDVGVGGNTFDHWVSVLMGMDIEEERAESLIERFGVDSVSEAYYQYIKRKPKVYSPAGWIIGALEGTWKWEK